MLDGGGLVRPLPPPGGKKMGKICQLKLFDDTCMHTKELKNGCHICDLTVNREYPLYTYCDREMAKVLKCKFYEPKKGGDNK